MGVGAAASLHRLYLLCRSRGVVVPPILPAVDAAERFEILNRYADHVRRFEDTAAQRGHLDSRLGGSLLRCSSRGGSSSGGRRSGNSRYSR